MWLDVTGEVYDGNTEEGLKRLVIFLVRGVIILVFLVEQKEYLGNWAGHEPDRDHQLYDV